MSERPSAVGDTPRDGVLSDREIDDVIAELRALAREVRTTDGRRGKDARAAQALALAGLLVDALAGWAVDHHVGLAVNRVAYEPLDLAPAPGTDADDDRHEEAGAAYDWSNPAINRRALANLLAANSGGFPYTLVLEAALAVEALDLDRTASIFERRKRGLDDNAATLARLRLRAIEHVIFYDGAGASRTEAEEKVAAAFDVTVEILRQWALRLPYLLGRRRVRDAIGRAEHAGITARRLGLPLCRAEVRRRDQQLRSDAARHAAIRDRFARHARR